MSNPTQGPAGRKKTQTQTRHLLCQNQNLIYTYILFHRCRSSPPSCPPVVVLVGGIDLILENPDLPQLIAAAGFRHPAQNRRADRRAKRSVEERSNKLEVEKHVWWLEAARAAHGQGPRVARGTTEEVRGRGYPAGLGSLQGTQPRPPDLEDARGARRLGLPPGRPPRPVTPAGGDCNRPRAPPLLLTSIRSSSRGVLTYPVSLRPCGCAAGQRGDGRCGRPRGQDPRGEHHSNERQGEPASLL